MEVLTIANIVGGSGRTWTTKKLAYLLAHHYHKRTLIVDLDKVTGSISSEFIGNNQAESSHFTILEALSDPNIVPHTIDSHLSLFAANVSLHRADQLLSRLENPNGLLRAFFETWPLAQQYDYCLFDTCAELDLLTRNALVAADALLVCHRWSDNGAAERSVIYTLEESRSLRREQALPEPQTIIIEQPIDQLDEQAWDHLVTRII